MPHTDTRDLAERAHKWRRRGKRVGIVISIVASLAGGVSAGAAGDDYFDDPTCVEQDD